MKILLVTDYGSLVGGAEVMAKLLRDSLRERGHDVRIFTSNAGCTGSETYGDYSCHGTTSRWRTLLQTASPWAYRSLRAVLREFEPDVVHVKMFLTQLSPLILPLLRDIPALLHVDWYRPICPVGTKLLPDGSPCRFNAGYACLVEGCLPIRDWVPLMGQQRLWRRWRNVFDLVVANSENTQRKLEQCGLAAAEVVYNGIPERHEHQPLGASPKVVYAGRMVPEKGVAVLLRAFSQLLTELPEARLLLIGSGPEMAAMQELARELNITRSIVFTGFLEREELESRASGAWVQAIPSVWEEPFGIVALEAMSRGTAVVASKLGGLAEIIDDAVSGFLVPANDVDALSARLRQLLTDPQLAKTMGRKGRLIANERFSMTRCGAQFEAIYDRLVNRDKLERATIL